MKYIPVILFVFVMSPSLAQSAWLEDTGVSIHNSQIRRIVIFQDTVKWGHYILRERDYICYNLKDSNEFLEGRVRRIHTDTLLMDKRYIVLGKIDKLVKSHVRAPSLAVHRSRIFLIPDTAYHAINSKLESKHIIMQSVKVQRAINRTDTVSSNFIKLNLARLLGLEIAISYERKLSRYVSLDFEVAYGFPLYNTSKPGNADPLANFRYFPMQGFSILAGPKFYRLFKNRPGLYLEPMFHFKDERFINAHLPPDPSVHARTDDYLSGDKYTKIYGLSLRIGALRNYGNVIIDYYLGLGLKVKDNICKYYYYYDYNYRYFNSDESPVVHKFQEIKPIINLGIKIGFGF